MWRLIRRGNAPGHGVGGFRAFSIFHPAVVAAARERGKERENAKHLARAARRGDAIPFQCIDELATAEQFRANAARTVAALEERRRDSNAESANLLPTPNVKSQDDAELDAWGKTIPASALERFGRKALPALQKRCATSGCHEPGTPGVRYSARPKAFGPAQRLALLYTLRETIASW